MTAKRKKRHSPVIVLERALLQSRAWVSLGGAAPSVYLIFRCKCQLEKDRTKDGRADNWRIINNGQIVLTYDEAQGEYGITAPRFDRAIGQLVARGFLDIPNTGMGLHKVTTLYSISDRWKHYGTSKFKKVARPKARQHNMGFKRGNRLWQRRKTKTTDENVHGSMHTNVHGGILAMHTNDHGQIVRNRYNLKNGKWLATEIA